MTLHCISIINSIPGTCVIKCCTLSPKGKASLKNLTLRAKMTRFVRTLTPEGICLFYRDGIIENSHL